MCILVCNRIDL